MAWNISARGTKAQCITAVAAIPTSTSAVANAQLARFQTIMNTEINACTGPSVSVVANGDFDGARSRADINVQTIPGLLAAEILSVPNNT